MKKAAFCTVHPYKGVDSAVFDTYALAVTINGVKYIFNPISGRCRKSTVYIVSE